MSPRAPTFALVFLLAASPLAALAQATASPSTPDWDQLSAAQRAQLVAPLRERWNRSDPEQRAAMLARAQRWQAMTPEQREHARHGMKRWRDMSPETRQQARALFEHLRSLPEAERKAMTERWKSMSAEQRKAWVEAHPPSPEARPR